MELKTDITLGWVNEYSQVHAIKKVICKGSTLRGLIITSPHHMCEIIERTVNGVNLLTTTELLQRNQGFAWTRSQSHWGFPCANIQEVETSSYNSHSSNINSITTKLVFMIPGTTATHSDWENREHSERNKTDSGWMLHTGLFLGEIFQRFFRFSFYFFFFFVCYELTNNRFFPNRGSKTY